MTPGANACEACWWKSETMVGRIVPLEGVTNFRDYGGYAAADGARVRRGVLWRSGQHVAASDADLDRIAGLQLATVIDLRGKAERALNPCRRPAGFAARVLFSDGETAGLASHIDAGQGAMDIVGARAAMRRLYAEMPYRPTLVEVLRGYFAALAAGEGASLVHCFAGKDRTGFAVAMTHHALGVHRDDAVSDYLLTNLAMAGRTFPGNAGSDSSKYSHLSPEAMQALGGVAAEYLDSAFTALHESHGSADAYLADVLGVDAAVRDVMRAHLLEG